MSLDVYFNRRYNRNSYNCLAFAVDVWKDVTGQDIETELNGLLNNVKDRKVKREHVRSFQALKSIQDPCLVLMQRQCSTPHVGVYIRGRVIHILDRGVEYQPLDVVSQCFTSVKFYTCKS